MEIKELPLEGLQKSVLSRIVIVYNDLKEHPQKTIVLNCPGETPEEQLKNYVSTLTDEEKKQFNKEMLNHLKEETLTECKLMLIINYLDALLIEERTNKISIHHNYQHKQNEIEKFKSDNKQTLTKIKKARNKVYSHRDPDWLKEVQKIGYHEIEKCIVFLKNLFE